MSNALKKYLEEKGLTVADLVRETGLPYMTIRNHVLGSRKLPNVEAALTYEEKLGIPVSAWRQSKGEKQD
jgi:transcriptional regulator with XRE-family HTH domain